MPGWRGFLDRVTLPAVAVRGLGACALALAAALPWFGSMLGLVEPTAPRGVGTEPVQLRPELIWLPGGTLAAGPGVEQVRVEVTSFAICRAEVTRAQWEAVMGAAAPCEQECSPDQPVRDVSWEQRVAYLNKVSEREHLSPCYVDKDGELRWEPRCTGYRLPSETEWRYAGQVGAPLTRSWPEIGLWCARGAAA